jgi:Fic family protein
LIPLLGQAHRQIGQFDALLRVHPLPFRAYSFLRYREAIGSLRSQNIRIGLKQVLSSKGNSDVDKIIAYKRALDRLPQWIPHGIYSDRFFCKIHSFVKQDSPCKPDIGHLRNRQNWIGPNGCTLESAFFVPPKASLVPRYLHQFKKYAKTADCDPIVQLAILFGQFLVIHPFMDGNGRVIRIFIPAFFFSRGLTKLPLFFMSTYFERHRQLYFRFLHEITTEKGWEGWITFFLRGVIQEGKIQCTLLQKHLNKKKLLCIR